jgi:hypothetical protein
LRAVEKLLPFSGKIAEQEMRLRLAHSIADHSAIEWQADVLGRKTVIALGQARFRGREYILGHWGLGETPAS